MVAVSDTGTGMPPACAGPGVRAVLHHQGDRQGKRASACRMVYGFVKQSGGHVRIYSEEGHGTTIKLYLPPAHGAVDAVAAPRPRRWPAAPRPSWWWRTMRWCATSSPRNCTISATGPSAAADGPAALAQIRNGEAFDLLFTDVIMPGGMTGRQLAEEVAKLRPGMKVLYTSGYTDNAIVHHGRLDEGVLLLTKPYRKAQLAKMVREALVAEDLPAMGSIW